MHNYFKIFAGYIMICLKLFAVSVFFLFFTITVGCLLVDYDGQPLFKSFCESYILGWVVMFAVFECIAVPCTFLKFHLSTLTIIWSCIICTFSILGFLKIRKKMYPENLLFLSCPKHFTALSVINFILIAFQCSLQLFFQHIDEDDAWFIAASVAAADSNTLNLISPYTGDPLRWEQTADYLLAPFPLFWAMISKVFHTHPTIIMHTITPFFLVCAVYMVYYLLGKQIFDSEQKKFDLFIFFICIINLSQFSFPRTLAAMLLVRIWQGKAMMAAFLLPLLAYYLLDHANTNNVKTVEYKIVAVLTAMALGSSMGIFLGILLVGIYVIALYLLCCNYVKGIRVMWTIIPSILLGIFYAVIR